MTNSCMCGHDREEHNGEDGHCTETDYDFDGEDEYSFLCRCRRFN